MNFFNRKLATAVPVTTELVQLHDNKYSLITTVPFVRHEQKFSPGQELDNTTIDGRKIKNIFTMDGNKLVEKQIEPNREVTIIREYFDKEMSGTKIIGKLVTKNWNTFVE